MNQAQIPKNSENTFTQKFGFPSEKATGKIVNYLKDSHISFIKESPFAVIATANIKGECDASPKGGLPGFIKVLDKEIVLNSIKLKWNLVENEFKDLTKNLTFS